MCTVGYLDINPWSAQRHRAAYLLVFLAVLVAGAASAADDPWPREIRAKQGKVVIYQPQLETFRGDQLSARAAVSVQKTGMKAPVFGVVWFESRVSTDRDTRMVELKEVKVSRIKFPNAKPEQEKKLAAFLEKEIAGWPNRTISLDRLLAALAAVEKERGGARYNTQPPVILFSKTPAVLVLIDGKPILRDIAGSKVQRVVNTPFVLLFDPEGGKYYLTGDALWFAASQVMGPWELLLESPPATVVTAAQGIAEAEVPTKVRPETVKAGVVPKIIVAFDPTELIVADGEPEFTALAGTDLLYLANSSRDVFMEVGSQQYYVVLAGRWFKSPSLENGPWSYVESDKLPPGFYRIPPDSVKGHVLAFVPGTQWAQEAVADAQIPVTAGIPRNATTKISYDGEPKFQGIEGTSMQYAVNTDKPVLKVGDGYYAVDNAVWYEAKDPQGPWKVATSVPDQVYDMPPTSPVYNTKYVRVYESTPDTVYQGYTPGYTGSYVSGETVVYGTGYSYPPYVSTSVYYPPPVTYGYAPVYNPGYGAWNFLAGAAFGFVAGAAISNWWGCGCCGWHGNADVDINRNVNISGNNFQSFRGGRQDVRNNLYNNRSNWRQQVQGGRRNDLNQRVSARQRGERPAGEARLGGREGVSGQRVAGREAARGEGLAGRGGERPAARAGTRPAGARAEAGRAGTRPAGSKQQLAQRGTARAGGTKPSRAASERAQARDVGKNNVLADRDGNVYRRNESGWQQRSSSGWSSSGGRAQSSLAQNRSNLDRDYSARARGTERTQNFQRASSGGAGRASSGRTGGGGARASGGRAGGGGGGGRAGGGGGRRR